VGGYRLLEHTADMGIEATGETLPELFLQAALGLRAIISESPASPESSKVVEVTGGDPSEVLVNWLNEILYLLEVHHFFPADFQVEEVGQTRMRGRIRGELLDGGRHFIEREVKAVTFHQIEVEEVAGIWRVRIFVDL
jgi:SHS2 domain-containing protein